MIARKGGKEMQQTVFQLDVEAHKALRFAALEDGISMGEALRQAVQLWLEQRTKKRKGVKK